MASMAKILYKDVNMTKPVSWEEVYEAFISGRKIIVMYEDSNMRMIDNITTLNETNHVAIGGIEYTIQEITNPN